MITTVRDGSWRAEFSRTGNLAATTAWASGAEDLVLSSAWCNFDKLFQLLLVSFAQLWDRASNGRDRRRRKRLVYDLFLYHHDTCIDTRLIGIARSRLVAEEFVEEAIAARQS